MKALLSKFSHLSTINLILALRAMSILVQLCLVLFVTFALHYDIPLFPVLTIVLIEVCFNGVSYWRYQKKLSHGSVDIAIQLLADVLFLAMLLYFSGGATNAFISLLLIPIAIAAVSLPPSGLMLVACTAVLTYSLLLWTMPMHVMHGNMEGHFIGMWINFLFSAVVVSIVVAYLARAIKQHEIKLAQYREQQLKRERIIALGVASAQVTHNLATPIATMNLLIDELMEENIENQDVVKDLKQQVERCNASLHAFRETSEQIRTDQKFHINSDFLLNQLEQHCRLTYPESRFEFTSSVNKVVLASDASLLPALINIIDNAVRANVDIEQGVVKVVEKTTGDEWHLEVIDSGHGFFVEQLEKLGDYVQPSEHGFGISILLSNTSIERLAGKLTLSNAASGGAVVTLTLPIIKH